MYVFLKVPIEIVDKIYIFESKKKNWKIINKVNDAKIIYYHLFFVL